MFVMGNALLVKCCSIFIYRILYIVFSFSVILLTVFVMQILMSFSCNYLSMESYYN